MSTSSFLIVACCYVRSIPPVPAVDNDAELSDDETQETTEFTPEDALPEEVECIGAYLSLSVSLSLSLSFLLCEFSHFVYQSSLYFYPLRR